jgi:hypothetical protein
MNRVSASVLESFEVASPEEDLNIQVITDSLSTELREKIEARGSGTLEKASKDYLARLLETIVIHTELTVLLDHSALKDFSYEEMRVAMRELQNILLLMARGFRKILFQCEFAIDRFESGRSVPSSLSTTPLPGAVTSIVTSVPMKQVSEENTQKLKQIITELVIDLGEVEYGQTIDTISAFVKHSDLSPTAAGAPIGTEINRLSNRTQELYQVLIQLSGRQEEGWGARELELRKTCRRLRSERLIRQQLKTRQSGSGKSIALSPSSSEEDRIRAEKRAVDRTYDNVARAGEILRIQRQAAARALYVHTTGKARHRHTRHVSRAFPLGESPTSPISPIDPATETKNPVLNRRASAPSAVYSAHPFSSPEPRLENEPTSKGEVKVTEVE